MVSRRAHVSEDTGIGLLFVGMLALGVVIISREDTYAGDLTAFLFGDILGVRPSQVRVQALVAGPPWWGRGAVPAVHGAVVQPGEGATLGQRPALAHG